MGNTDITNTVKRLIKYGLVVVIVLSTAIGSAAFNHWHSKGAIKIDNAKVAGTMVSVRVLTNGKVKELLKTDGDEVKAGEVIAKIEVNITEDEIKQLENTVELAKQNYAKLQVGQMVKVPVMKPKPKPIAPTPKPQTKSRANSSTASLSALEERKNRMELLFEMGAISKNQRDEAVKEYELARAAANAPAPVEPEVAEEQQDSTPDFEIEYIEQLQPTPPEILNGAQLAIKQAELSLNVAKQEAQQTDVIAPVDGMIYYNIAVDTELNAGDVVAKVGGSSDLWLEAEVTESQFDKLTLGKLVSYIIDGKNLTGTVIEKIAPIEEVEETEIDEQQVPNENPTPSENSIPNDNEINIENLPASDKIDEDKIENTDTNPHQKDKYIVKFSLPVDRDFECKPNTTVAVTVSI